MECFKCIQTIKLIEYLFELLKILGENHGRREIYAT